MIKNTNRNRKANIIFNGKYFGVFPLRSGARKARMSFLPLLLNIKQKDLANSIRQEREIKDIQI